MNIEPVHTVIFSGLVWKKREVGTSEIENSESFLSRIGVCPLEVALDTAGQNQCVHVCTRVFNMSAKAFILPRTTLCLL